MTRKSKVAQTPRNLNKDKFNKEKEILPPKVLQETQGKNKQSPFLKEKETMQKETQDYKYAQSSKFSSVARQLEFGIIGSGWVLIYTDKKLDTSNYFLLAALGLALFFLFIDALHYYLDSRSYHKELYNLDEIDKILSEESFEVFRKKHEIGMDKYCNRSDNFIKAKFWILTITCVSFLIGFFYYMFPC